MSTLVEIHVNNEAFIRAVAVLALDQTKVVIRTKQGEHYEGTLVLCTLDKDKTIKEVKRQDVGEAKGGLSACFALKGQDESTWEAWEEGVLLNPDEIASVKIKI